jgi:hypothetical protein
MGSTVFHLLLALRKCKGSKQPCSLALPTPRHLTPGPGSASMLGGTRKLPPQIPTMQVDHSPQEYSNL